MSGIDNIVHHKFDAGLYCAESVLEAVAEHQGIVSELIPAIATGFCSGVARTCGTCGAVSGAIMAISMVFGRKSASDSLEKSYAAVQDFLEQFEREYGSVNCKVLLDCDLGTPEGQRIFHTDNLYVRCREFSGKAAKIAIRIIESESGPD